MVFRRSVKIGDPRQYGSVAFRIELNEHLFVFALSAEEDVIAIGIFPAGKIEAVGALKHFSDSQGIRPRGDHLEADNAVLRIEYELGALAEVRSVG